MKKKFEIALIVIAIVILGFVVFSLWTVSLVGKRSEPIDHNQRAIVSSDFNMARAENRLEIIDLDSVENFSELVLRMGQVDCDGKTSGLKFELDNTYYHITGSSECPTYNLVSCYFRKNTLVIRNDSLILGYGKDRKVQHIEYLKTELENIIEKVADLQGGNIKVNSALIYLNIENNYPIETTKKVLKVIMEQFENINAKHGSDFFKYHILFREYDISLLQPPPLPSSSY